jgi:hypothetical protein
VSGDWAPAELETRRQPARIANIVARITLSPTHPESEKKARHHPNPICHRIAEKIDTIQFLVGITLRLLGKRAYSLGA